MPSSMHLLIFLCPFDGCRGGVYSQNADIEPPLLAHTYTHLPKDAFGCWSKPEYAEITRADTAQNENMPDP